jgi:hypothetical protein
VQHARKIYFKNAVDMPLFCGEDLNFGAFSKKFPPGMHHASNCSQENALLYQML